MRAVPPSLVRKSAVSLLNSLSQGLRPLPKAPSPLWSTWPRQDTRVRRAPVTLTIMLTVWVG